MSTVRCKERLDNEEISQRTKNIYWRKEVVDDRVTETGDMYILQIFEEFTAKVGTIFE